MKEIVAISGKGGTGKTSLTASFSVLGGEEVIAADCDVDAADMHLLLKPDFAGSEDFFSGYKAVIDPLTCSGCGACERVCRFDAIDSARGGYKVVPLNCEGCGYCERVCPEKAIRMEEQKVGQWFRSSIKTGGTMVHAKLGIGADNSGKLVAQVKREAKKIAEEEGKKILLVDGSPGIGCPVVSSLTGADFVVFVTEPTVSGLHDLKRVYRVVERFNIPSGCIINKADINEEVTRQIKEFLADEGITHLSDLPYDENFTAAMTDGQTIVEYAGSKLLQEVTECWHHILQIVSA